MDTQDPEASVDYIWHFKLGADDEAAGHDEELVEMVRRQISALLRCVRFTSGGRDVTVTGFRLLDEPGREHLVPSLLASDPPGEDE